MNKSIEQLLRENYVDGVFHTHVSMVQPKGKFQFNRQQLEEFWDKYCMMIKENKNVIVGIAEKPQHYLPVLADIDIKIKDDNDIDFGEHLYTEEQVSQIVNIYQSVIRTIVEGCTDDHLICVLLEKPMYYLSAGETTYAKNGFHLHFPYLFLSKIDQEVHLIPRVQQVVSKMQVFADLGFEDSARVIDKASCSVPWLLYGSRKSEDMDPYVVTKVFDSGGSQISLEEAFKHYLIFDNQEKQISIRGKIEQYLPRILSILPYNRPTQELKPGLISPLKEKLQEKKDSKKNTLKVSVEESLRISEKLLPMLADWRAEERNEWMTVGWILFNIGEGSTQALDQWMEFSSRCQEKYDESNCIYEWERMVKKDLTLGTLRYYASIDSPELYKAYKREQAEFHIKEALNGSHNDIAKVLHAEYGNEFVCASMSNRVWYQFRNHRWEEIEEGVYLRERISDEIVERFSEMGKELFTKLTAVQDKAEESMYTARLKQVQKLMCNLKSSPFKNNIMKEAMEVFYDCRFKNKLDKNPYIFAFKNGIYDLKLNEFRPGRPEDYVSKSAPIDYKEYTMVDEEVQNVIEFLTKVFPDPTIRTYFLDTYSDIFVGGNNQKKVYMWTGEGDNGKSITQLLVDSMLGELAVKFNTQYFTGKKVASGSANPELARAAPPVRSASMEEPDADETLNIGELKKLSGGDSFFARDLFEKGKNTKEVFPMFMLTFVCLSGNTCISTTMGYSLSLKYFEKYLYETFACNIDEYGLVPSIPNKFLVKGSQECVKLTLLDNTTITCTPDHKFLTHDYQWIQASDIKLGETKLTMGPIQPKCDDICQDYNFILKISNYSWNMSNHSDRLKASALCRLMGYMLTDGSSNRTLYIEHYLDTQPILSDIKLLTGKTPKIINNNRVKQISIPMELTKCMEEIIPWSGKRVENYTPFPEFIFMDDCPIFLIREFTASLFGGDGIVPIFNRNCFSNIQLICSKKNYLIEEMIKEYTKLSQLLYEKFQIESYVRTAPYTPEKQNIFLVIGQNESMLKFCMEIGVRYCCHKSYRLSAVKSCLQYKKAIIYQNNWILNRTKELCDKNTIKDSIEQAKKEYRELNEFYIDEYMITYSQIRSNYLFYNKQYTNTMVNYHKFMEDNNLLQFVNQGNGKGSHHYSVEKDNKNLPLYSMLVIGRKNVGVQDVFDINMDEKYSNFLAEGIVTHNCNKLPKLKYSDKATWNRIRVLPFEATFVEPGESCPATLEEQLKEKRFPMDKEFKHKIPGMVTAFAWYLLEWRKKITVRVEPEKVREATAIYRRQNDIYRQFIEECLIEDDSAITISEIYAQFKEWFKEGWPHMTLPIKNDVKEYFDRVWGDADRGSKWRGWRIRTIKDDVESGDAVILNENDLVNYDDDGLALPPI